MDTEWALGELREFVADIVDYDARRSAFAVSYEETVAYNLLQTRRAQVVEQILDRALPQWRASIAVSLHHEWRQHRNACLRAIEELDRQTELHTKLGDGAPTFDADRLHPWVWQGARSLWQSGHYRQAVAAAARQVNAETQNLYGTRELTETALFTQAFSDDEPKTDRPRLRFLDDDGGKSAASLRRGIRNYAEGCFAAIRNPAAHDVLEELPEHEALEQLAVFSVLARWVDRAQVLNA